MPRILSRQTYKGTFIHDQQMFWLDLPEDRRAEGMEPEIFRLAGVSDEGSPQILAGMRLKQNPWQSVERYDVLHKGSLVIRSGKLISVFVEEPIATEGLSEENVAELRDRVQEAIAARVDPYFDAKAEEESR